MTDRAIDRRDFLTAAGAALFLGATHGPGSWADSGPSGASAKGDHRLLALDLKTSAPLEEMRDFYGGLLGLAIESRDDRLIVSAGLTRITFNQAEPPYSSPFYHFAFNIPENKILAARAWQLERTPLVPPGENLRDPDFPDDVVHFRSWDAHSVFFWDPGGNMVEHIARHTLDNAAPGPFTPKDILYASEIAFVTDDVEATSKTFRDTFRLPQYKGGSDQFRALGDEHGLLLVFKQGRIMGFDNGKPIATAPVRATIRGGPTPAFEAERYPFTVTG